MFQLIKYSGTNVQVTDETGNILFKKSLKKNFIYQHIDEVDINENWQFLKCQKTGILTEFVYNLLCKYFLTTYASMF